MALYRFLSGGTAVSAKIQKHAVFVKSSVPLKIKLVKYHSSERGELGLFNFFLKVQTIS